MMDFSRTLPILLGVAWLLPLASFVLVLLFGPRMGRHGRRAGMVATVAIVASLGLSLAALATWLAHYPLRAPAPGEPARRAAEVGTAPGLARAEQSQKHQASEASPGAAGQRRPGSEHEVTVPEAVSGEWYLWGVFDRLRFSIGYYVDGLTIAMFTMVTLVASCIHIYSFGYMHEELEEVTDRLAPLSDGRPLKRRGRYSRFFQYMSLFCFSMLGLVIAGNVAMVFVFWELVGICSYLLIGFYFERRSASRAANKAFIVNRVGDFGMIIGLMAVWTGFGTFSFGDWRDASGAVQPGIFHQVRPTAEQRVPQVPDGMVRLAARGQVGQIVRSAPSPAVAERRVAARLPQWRAEGYGYWLLLVAGLGIFCGCVGKSAQVPLHVWLPDAMEGPTPVSALIHAATMVAAGVYLAGRFYPVFLPEVLLAVAVVGAVTLFVTATVAVVATDIKRVLAYSTVSQLGYMMLSLGIGGWLGAMFHLFTHAFFKSLLFLCSGSVIHACGTNEMPQMGGLRKKMPYTAYTMLVGCLAIAGAGIPTTVIGLSGFYSKDYIIAQAMLFRVANPIHGWMFYTAVLGASMTAFYMFRLWYLTFAGTPRDPHVATHAHESPRVMIVPLVVLAVLAVSVGWNVPATGLGLEALLEQARPLGTAGGGGPGMVLPRLVHPAEHGIHAPAIHFSAGLWAFGAALVGFVFATLFYGLRRLDPEDARRTFAPVYRFLVHKWWFDELYDRLLLRPVMAVSGWVAVVDRRGIDRLVDGLGWAAAAAARLDDWIDRTFVDSAVDRLAGATYAVGLRLRSVQTGNIRQYVMWIVLGTVALFVLVSLTWNYAAGGM